MLWVLCYELMYSVAAVGLCERVRNGVELVLSGAHFIELSQLPEIVKADWSFYHSLFVCIMRHLFADGICGLQLSTDYIREVLPRNKSSKQVTSLRAVGKSCKCYSCPESTLLIYSSIDEYESYI